MDHRDTIPAGLVDFKTTKTRITETCSACSGVGETRELGFPQLCAKCEGQGKITYYRTQVGVEIPLTKRGF